MGVYIPTAEMPHNLLECFYGEQCQEYEDCNGLERGKKCPLIEIDDELFKKAESAYVLQQIRRR